ncbi:MAG TPA: hypothetical protein VHO92_08785 [Methanobacterium sp.]|nr:hypothetical protein [Methanobacterium sp.]
MAIKPKATIIYPINSLFKSIYLIFLNISNNLKASLKEPPLKAICGIATVNITSEMKNKINKRIINMTIRFSESEGSPKFI